MCDNVLAEALKSFGTKKKHVLKKVEVDVQLMVNTHDKLARGLTVDHDVVSNLLLGGVINILQQHDAIGKWRIESNLLNR